jgi:hypothetical protein
VVFGEKTEKSTAGEKELYNHLTKLEAHYPDFYICYQPSVGDYRPDFLIIGPKVGVVVVEVKDYSRLQTVSKTDRWVLQEGNQKVTNPFRQLKGYLDEVKSQTVAKGLLVDLPEKI